MTVISLIERAAKLLWKHRVLAALGILDIVLTSSGLFERALGGLAVRPFADAFRAAGLPLPQGFAAEDPLLGVGQIGELYRLVSPYGAAGWIGLIGGFLLALIALAVVGIVIDGGIIVAVRDAAEGKSISAGGVFAAGWRRVLPMVVIASVPAIPLTIGATIVVIIATTVIQSLGGVDALTGSQALMSQATGLILLFGGLILIPCALITLPLMLLAALASQACMLDNHDAIAAFRRALSVLRANTGPALFLVAISYAVSLIAGAVASLPNFLVNLFLPAIALLWIIHGIARAFYLALWSVGWIAMTRAMERRPAQPS